MIILFAVVRLGIRAAIRRYRARRRYAGRHHVAAIFARQDAAWGAAIARMRPAAG